MKEPVGPDTDTLISVRAEPPFFRFQPLRTRVLQWLEKATASPAKVLAIVAPVGYGKTVLMSQLFEDLRRNGKQCVWYALDDRDHTIEGILSAFEAQLHRNKPELHPTQALIRGEEPTERRIDKLLRLIDRYPVPLTLFLDNLNSCSDPALGRLLDRLTFETRPTLQLVLSSTRDIPFDVSRAQLEGLLQRVGPQDLAFNDEDITQLLGQHLSQQIGPQGLATVTRNTEGWPAAVRMVQIILDNTPQPVEALSAFSGSDETLSHLLNRKVLAGFSDALRTFLLCIAQLRCFNLELCRAAVEQPDMEQHLSYLVERNIFIIPLDRNRDWYRLHGLFRDFLLREAQRHLPQERVRDVLVKAARWCEKNGQWRDAVDYALASGSGETTSQILEHIAPILVRDLGLVAQYVRWVEQLRAQGHEPGPITEFWNVWALAFHRRFEAARQQALGLAARMERLQGKQATQQRDDLLRRIAILKSAIDSLCDHLPETYAGVSQWLAQAGSTPDDPFNLTAAHSLASFYNASMHRFVEARRHLQSAREFSFQTGSSHIDGWVQTYGTLGQIYEGDFVNAYREILADLATKRSILGENAGICGTMALVAAKCAVEMGLNEEATHLVEAGFKTARSHGYLDAVACGLEAAVLLWQGGSNERFPLGTLHDIAACYPPRLSYMLSCYLIQRQIVLGRTEQAKELADRIGLFASAHTASNAPGTDIAYMAALVEDTALALMVASGRLTQAEHAIEQALQVAKNTQCAARQVSLLLSAAHVAMQSGQHPVAIRHVTRAISVAAPRGIVRPFNDQRDTLASIVADTKPNAWGFATDAERQFFADRCRTLRFDDAALYDRLLPLQDEAPFLASKLTARELELLKFIEAGLSNQQIADRVEVALTTVKWHLQNLFTKLSVTNRSAALARARMLNLL